MMKRFVLIFTVIIFAFSLFSCGDKADESSAPEDTQGSSVIQSAQSSPNNSSPYHSIPISAPGPTTNEKKAKDFKVQDWNGNDVMLSSLKGKPIVLNFWASWCPPCKEELPDFEQMYKKYGKDVHFVMVDLTGGTETVEKAKSHIIGNGYTFPVYFDTYYEAYRAYNVQSIPQTYFIDDNLNIVLHIEGMLDATRLENGISSITKKNK